MADSKEFGFVNAANYNIYVDQLRAFEKFLRLGIDSILAIEPERIHISEFCVDNKYKNRPVPKNWESDGEGGYWETIPAHYWMETSKKPLEVCILGSGRFVDIKEVKHGRETFADQDDLAKRTIQCLKGKTFENDVLPYIPFDEFRGRDINEPLLKAVLNSPLRSTFDLREFGEGMQEVTGEDLRGIEKIGYTITQDWTEGNILKVGLCKAYYPK